MLIRLLLTATAFTVSVFAQSDEGYIEKTFRAKIGEVPKLGWFVPDRGFVAKDDAAGLLIYSSLGLPVAGRKAASISHAAIAEIQKTYGEACEVEGLDHLTAYAAGTGDEEGRALYTRKSMPGEIRFGLVTVPVDLVAVNQLLGWPEQGTLRRDEAVAVRAQTAFYSFHRLYNLKTGLLTQEAVVLHDKTGKIVAHHVHKALEAETQCDGCANATYTDSRSGIYTPMNLFELPGFVYPVVLLDSGTVESAGLAMMTFTPAGRMDKFVVNEYVVNCR